MNATPDMLATAFKMLAALGVVLGGVAIFFYFTKRVMRKELGGSKEKLIRVLANHYIGFKKNISLVEVPGAILVIGISGDNMRLLTKIEDRRILDKFEQDQTAQITPSFSEHLDKITSRFKARKSRK